jgi:hypothetical protein
MTTRPTILIYVINPNLKLLKEVCAGIEEEGIYYEVIHRDNGEINTLCYESANTSILGTGIAMKETIIALTLSSLPKGKQVFKLEDPSWNQARNLGTNAARAVKRKSFKEIGCGNKYDD